MHCAGPRRTFTSERRDEVNALERRVYIIELSESFPCLESHVAHYTPLSWDVDEFMAHLGTMSSGERLCAKFIASVWNPGHAKAQGWSFDLIDFAGRVDSGNLNALIEWLNNPRFP